MIRDAVRQASEIAFGKSSDGTQTTYLPSYRNYFTCEISPLGTSPANVSHGTLGSLNTLRATIGNKTYTVLHNPTDTSIGHMLEPGHVCHFPRGDAPGLPPLDTPGMLLTIAPHSHVLLVASADQADRLPGWENFPALLQDHTLKIPRDLHRHAPGDTLTLNQPTLTLDWQDVPMAESYDVYLWPKGQPMPEQPSATVSVSQWAVDASVALGDYKWQVVARNPDGTSTSPVWPLQIDNTLDTDGDGWPDWLEGRFGTDSDNSASTPLVAAQFEADLVKFQYQTYSGMRYDIESSLDLNVWSPMEEYIGRVALDDRLEEVDMPLTPDRKFYRIRIFAD